MEISSTFKQLLKWQTFIFKKNTLSVLAFKVNNIFIIVITDLDQ